MKVKLLRNIVVNRKGEFGKKGDIVFIESKSEALYLIACRSAKHLGDDEPAAPKSR